MVYAIHLSSCSVFDIIYSLLNVLCINAFNLNLGITFLYGRVKYIYIYFIRSKALNLVDIRTSDKREILNMTSRMDRIQFFSSF